MTATAQDNQGSWAGTWEGLARFCCIGECLLIPAAMYSYMWRASLWRTLVVRKGPLCFVARGCFGVFGEVCFHFVSFAGKYPCCEMRWARGVETWAHRRVSLLQCGSERRDFTRVCFLPRDEKDMGPFFRIFGVNLQKDYSHGSNSVLDLMSVLRFLHVCAGGKPTGRETN